MNAHNFRSLVVNEPRREVQIWLLDSSQSGFSFIAPTSKDCYQPSGLPDKAGKGLVFCLFISDTDLISVVLSQS